MQVNALSKVANALLSFAFGLRLLGMCSKVTRTSLWPRPLSIRRLYHQMMIVQCGSKIADFKIIGEA